MKVILLDSADWPNQEIGKKLSEAVDASYHAAKKILPKSSKEINFLLRPDAQASIKETGCGGWTYDSELIKISFDPELPYGEKNLLREIRATVFHEYNHAARYHSTKFDGSLLNGAVSEGLATVFERDYAEVKPPLWSKYEDDETMASWLHELLDFGDDWSKWDAIAFNHPDGRKWVAYKTGTWLIDKAMQKSGKSIAQLTGMSATEIVKLSQVTKK